MEMESVKQLCASMESQLVSQQQQIDSLTSEVDEHKTRVSNQICYNQYFTSIPSHAEKELTRQLLLQVASTRNNHDQAQSELNNFRSKMKECDTQISSILREQQELQRKITDTNLDKKKMENEVTCQGVRIAPSSIFAFQVFGWKSRK